MAKRVLNAGDNKLATCNIYGKYEKPVQPGLALTPRDVKTLTERGLAVSTPNIGQIEDPAGSSDYLEPQYRRDCDMNTAWELSRRVTSKLVNAHKNDKRKYGG